MIYGDESALRVKMHVDALHTVPTPCSLSTHTHTQAQTNTLCCNDIIGECEGSEGARGHDLTDFILFP